MAEHRRNPDTYQKLNGIVEYFDEYGFAVFKEESGLRPSDERCHDYCRNPDSSFDVLKQWEKVLSNWNHYRNTKTNKVLDLIKKGIPSHLRGDLWKVLLESDVLAQNSTFSYPSTVSALRCQLMELDVTEYNVIKAEGVLSKLSDTFANSQINNVLSIEVLRQILLDVDRTFSTHIMFMGDTVDAVEGRAALFRILAAYAQYNKEVGYCQGMSYIAGMLLIVLSEEDSFWALVALCERPKYLQGYFDNSLDRIQAHAKVFDLFLQHRLPKLGSHLARIDMDPLIYLTPWFMCLFTSLPCWDTVLAIWDLLLFEGIQVIFRASMAIMQSCETFLMNTTDANILIPMLQRLSPEIVKSDVLLPIIWEFKMEKQEMECLIAVVSENKEQKLLRSSFRRRSGRRQMKTASFKCVKSRGSMRKKNEIRKVHRKTFLQKIVQAFDKNNGKTTPTMTLPASRDLSCLTVPLADNNSSCLTSDDSPVLIDETNPITHVSFSQPTPDLDVSSTSFREFVNKSALQHHTFTLFSSVTPARQDVLQGLNFESPEVEMRTWRKKAKRRPSLWSTNLQLFSPVPVISPRASDISVVVPDPLMGFQSPKSLNMSGGSVEILDPKEIHSPGTEWVYGQLNNSEANFSGKDESIQKRSIDGFDKLSTSFNSRKIAKHRSSYTIIHPKKTPEKVLKDVNYSKINSPCSYTSETNIDKDKYLKFWNVKGRLHKFFRNSKAKRNSCTIPNKSVPPVLQVNGQFIE